MFSSISWQDYLMAVAIALTIYYLVVGVKFYRSEVKELFKSKHKPLGLTMDTGEEPPPENNDLVEIENLISRVKEVFDMAANQQLTTAEVEEFLSLVFADYPSIKHSDWRASVNELVVSESEEIANIDLTLQQVNLLWDK